MISKSNVKSVSCDDVRIFRYLFQNNVLKTLLDFFVIAGIIKVSVSVIRPRPSARLITLIIIHCSHHLSSHWLKAYS